MPACCQVETPIANRLAAQKVGFTKAFVAYKSPAVEATRTRAVRQMLEVVHDASGNNFFESTGDTRAGCAHRGASKKTASGGPVPGPSDEDPDQLVRQLEQTINTAGLLEEGSGGHAVYGIVALPSD